MLSIIFPAFNEAENLGRFPTEVLPVLDRLGRAYEVIIVDDGSSDQTAAVAGALGQHVRLVQHDRNRGLGAALRTGFAAACGDLIVTMDTDLTFAPELVQVLLARYEQGDVDCVSGSPMLARDRTEAAPHRLVVSQAATLVYSLLLGHRMSSVSPILRLYRRADLQQLHLESDGFQINAEILFKLLRQGKRIGEVPAPLTQRLHGESKLSYRRELRNHLRLVVRMLAWRLWPL